MSAASLTYISQQISIYIGIPILVCGVTGNLFNAIVFLSLRTFRQSSCAFYLTVMSCTNIGQLMTALLSRIMISGFGIDWTQSSIFYCKFRVVGIQFFGLLSFSCYCLATVDQYFATCSRPRWQQWCTTKTALRLSLIFVSIWLFHAIPFLFFYNLIPISTTGRSVCGITNAIFTKYVTFFYQLVLPSSLPMVITVLFGFLAYRNVQQLAYRTVPIVRRELDRQLTKMVLSQVLFNVFTLLPYAVTLLIYVQIPADSDPSVIAVIQFINSIAMYLYYLYYAVSTQGITEEKLLLIFLSRRIHSSSTSLHRTDFVGNSSMS